MISPTIRKSRKDVRVTDDHMLRVDHIPVGKVFVENGKVIVEFCDEDRMRARCRGCRLVQVPLEDLLAVITEAVDKGPGKQ